MERKPKEPRTSRGRITRVLPAFTFLGHPQNAVFPAGEIVYFVYSAGRIKIGYSTGMRGRHRNLLSSGPFPPVVFLIVAGSVEDEQAIHRKFDAERLHGEWFALSDRLRTYLAPKLCHLGKTSLDVAEAEFKAYCEGVVAAYKAPPRRVRRPACKHGVMVACPHCERELDLAILEQINNGTYRATA